MKASKSLDKKTRTLTENALLKFTIVVFGLSSVISVGYAYKMRKDVRTIVTPSHFSKSFEVSDAWMDDDGLRQYMKDILSLLLNYTPKTANQNYSSFEKYVLPKDYSAAHEKLQGELKSITRLKIVSTFIVEDLEIDRVTKTITVRGLRRKESHGRGIIDGPEEWSVTYHIKNANFYVADFNKIER